MLTGDRTSLKFSEPRTGITVVRRLRDEWEADVADEVVGEVYQ